MEKDNEDEISVEDWQHNLINSINFFFEKYKVMNSLLGYILHNDYEGVMMMPTEEWNTYIANRNFSFGWDDEDGMIYIHGKENYE